MTWPVKKKVHNEKSSFDIDKVVNTRNEKLAMIKQILIAKSY